MKKPNEIDPKEYETVYVNRQVRAANGRKLAVGEPHKNLTEKEFKALRNLGVICGEKEAKALAKSKKALKAAQEANKPVLVGGGGGDVSAAVLSEVKRITESAAQRCDDATEKLAAEFEAFKAEHAADPEAVAAKARADLAAAEADKSGK